MVTSRISKHPLQLILPVGFLVATGVGLALHNHLVADARAQVIMNPQHVSRLSSYRIPDSLEFCGERVPLEIPDVRERMEQAFYVELSDAQIILDLKRSTKYFPFIEQNLRDMNLPEDLKYLAVAESALRNLISNKDAAGIWQFTDDTARRYGLIVNEYVDERFNFHKATQAALRCLNDLRTTFGSWSLAAAAYNMGGGGIKSSLDYQMVRNYYSLYLNDETYRFVFRIAAIKQIMEHYQSYGFDLTESDFYPPAETKLVVVARIPDIATWARQQGSSYKEVKYLNPWLVNRSLPIGTWAVELPKYSQPVVFTSAAPIIDDTTSVSGARQSSSQAFLYLVKPGDTLERIAERYGIYTKDIREWNGMGKRTSIHAGQRLRIYLDSQAVEK